MRSTNGKLRKALNVYIEQYLTSRGSPLTYWHDLDGLKKRKLLRVVTRFDAKNYFLKKGKPAGFEYELLQRFSQHHGLRLNIITVRNQADMLDLLKRGEADLATLYRVENSDSDIVSSFPYYRANNFLITRKTQSDLTRLNELACKRLAIYDANRQSQGIDYLNEKGITVSIIERTDKISTKRFLQGLVEGEYDVALIPAREYIKALEFHDDIRVFSALNDQPLYRWATLGKNRNLVHATNNFLKNEYRSTFYNLVYRKYATRSLSNDRQQLAISPYDKLVQKYADIHQFDWRLIAAQMYQESEFNPDAVSTNGAVGLMQLIPRTAKELGFVKVQDPETGIRAGIRYMKKLRDRFGSSLSINERNLFTLAAYNAGFERIRDARIFAKTLGLDPDRWFGHVEIAMQKLSKPEYRKHTRFGPCRCGQTVVYVRSIKMLYNSYVQLTTVRTIRHNS